MPSHPRYHVVGAVRDLDKMEAVAEIDDLDMNSFTAMHVELNDFSSVRSFCDELERFKGDKHVDRLICNAAVYQPSLPHAKWSVDGALAAHFHPWPIGPPRASHGRNGTPVISQATSSRCRSTFYHTSC